MPDTSAQIRQSLSDLAYGEILASTSLAGGSINSVVRLKFSGDSSLILKRFRAAPPGFFEAEASGLLALEQRSALRVPKIIHVAQDFLLLEDLGDAMPRQDYWQSLGRGLAILHSEIQPLFGFNRDNFCGSTTQINRATADGFQFFADWRILNLATMAQQKGLLSNKDMVALEFIAQNLDNWIPQQAAVLIHGDLWSGNIHVDNKGEPALIDPATYWGWAEAELAMTLLFGGFHGQFYDSYTEISKPEPQWQERAPLYNLYHLLNHLLLFGNSYLNQIRSITARFASVS